MRQLWREGAIELRKEDLSAGEGAAEEAAAEPPEPA